LTIRNNTKYGILLIGALSLLTLVVLGLSNSSHDSTKLVNNEKSLSGESSSLLIALNHTELSSHSDTIITGTVKEILPSKWNSVDGKRPDEDVRFSPFNLIYTDIIISVDKYVKNPLSSKEIIVRVEGGTVGNDTLVTESEPAFQPGEKVLLYLMKDDSPGTKDIGPEHFIVTGCLQGKYTLTDGKAIRPGETVSQNELLSTIKQ
jgi:hypothetical protein